MSLNREAVRRALLSRANARATQHANWNEPIEEALEGRKYQGGSKKQSQQDKEDEKIAMEVKGLEDKVEEKPKPKGKGRGRPKKQTKKDKEDEKLAMEVKGVKDKVEDEDDTDMEGEGMSGGAAAAYGAGRDYAKNIMEMDDDVKEMVGKGFWKDFAKGFQKGFMGVIKPAAKVAKVVAPAPVGKVLDAVGLGKGSDMSETRAVGSGKKRRAKAGASDKRKARGAMISKLMKEKGMSLGEASKHIKEKGLI